MNIKKLFERRRFTDEERSTMEALYAEATILAERIDRTMPTSVEKELAIFKLKECLAYCETAVAMNPRPSMMDLYAKAGIAPDMPSAEIGRPLCK
jgi:hypothetical protein